VDLLTAYRAFVRVAEAGSFSAVAREMGTTQPAVSRQVAALEDHLGARLIQRSTRRLTLTEDGREFLAQARHALEAFEESLASVGRQQRRPAGLVRIGAPLVFGRRSLAPRIPRLLARYPELSVDLRFSGARQDLISEGLDLVIRPGEVGDTSLVARRLGSFAILTVASAEYLDRHGEPARPQDLATHECVIFDRDENGRIWHFEGPGGAASVRVQGRFASDSIDAIREAVLAGVGIAVLPAWLVSEALTEGRVRPVLQDWPRPRLPLHVVYPSRRHLPPRTRAVIDFLVQEFRLDPVVSEYGAG
jgi:DNA-binding transcriptional LysR family regulator